MPDKALSLSRKILKQYGKPLRHRFNAFIAKYSLLSNDEVLSPEQFNYLRPLEARWKDIRREADAVLSQESIPSLGSISLDHKRLDYQGKWLSYFLWGYGYKVEKNCRKCPVTVSLVEKVPGLLTAMFSIHEPGAHLPRHRGVTKGMLTYHLGLRIPEGCYINVEDQGYHWQEGRFFVFDDTYYHEVFNNSEQNRLILLLHVRRPLRNPGKLVQNLFFWLIRHSPFVRDTKRALGA